MPRRLRYCRKQVISAATEAVISAAAWAAAMHNYETGKKITEEQFATSFAMAGRYSLKPVIFTRISKERNGDEYIG